VRLEELPDAEMRIEAGARDLEVAEMYVQECLQKMESLKYDLKLMAARYDLLPRKLDRALIEAQLLTAKIRRIGRELRDLRENVLRIGKLEVK